MNVAFEEGNFDANKDQRKSTESIIICKNRMTENC